MRVRNWDKHQCYRKDRGQPPWIKLHRILRKNWKWVSLSDAERGQLTSIWLLAADNDGELPDDPEEIRRVCKMSDSLDLNRFVELELLEGDVKRRQVTPDVPQKKKKNKNKNNVPFSGELITASALCSIFNGVLRPKRNRSPSKEMITRVKSLKRKGYSEEDLGKVMRYRLTRSWWRDKTPTQVLSPTNFGDDLEASQGALIEDRAELSLNEQLRLDANE